MTTDNIVICNPAASLKRPLPDGGHHSRDAIKRRSSRACRTCRARKVRCDITIHGSPCTNCRLDSVECVLLVSKRGPKPRSHSPKSNPAHHTNANIAARPQPQRQIQRDGQQPGKLQSHSEPCFQYCQHCQHYPHSHYHQEEEEEEDNEEQEAAPMTPVSSSHQLSAAAIPEIESVPSSSAASNLPAGKIHEVAVGLTFDHDEDDGDGNNNGNASDGGHGTGRNTPSLHATSNILTVSDFGSVSSAARVEMPLSILNGKLPSFIRPLPKTLTEDDLEFLERKGAFTMPDLEMRDEILRSYLSVVHPFMPILDVRAFLTAVSNNTKGDRISLLLFQAVMFAGLSALDLQLIQRMGFKTTKHARQVFFARVRLLHDMDVESDHKSLLQALLLMSLWYGGPNDQRNTWYYTGMALSLAQNLGLHHEPDESHPQKHLRRRLWWSLYIRDRLIALGTRRPMRIRDDEHEVSMLSQQDFDCEIMDESIAHFFNGGHFLQDIEYATHLPLMCIELAKLCICIGHVLTSQYTTLGRRSLWTKALMVVPKQDIESPAVALELERCDRELADWYQELHPDVAMVARSSASEWSSYKSTQWHWTLVDMLRLTLISLLHRPQGLRPFPTNVTNNDTSSIDLIKASRAKLKSTARELTRLAHGMLHHDQIRYLPTSGTPMVLSAILTHLMDLEAQDDDVRDASIYRFDQMVQVLKQLKEIYASADSAINYLGMVIRKTGISARVPQVAAIFPEFRGTMSTGKRNATVTVTAEPRSQRRHSTMVKETAMAMLPRSNGQSRPDCDAATRLTADIYVPHQTSPTLRSNQAGQKTKSQNLLSARTPDNAEFGLVAMSEVHSFESSSLPGGDTCAVETQERQGGDRLDQQNLSTYDNLFGPLSSLDYDIDPELFNTTFDFYHDESFWLDTVAKNR